LNYDLFFHSWLHTQTHEKAQRFSLRYTQRRLNIFPKVTVSSTPVSSEQKKKGEICGSLWSSFGSDPNEYQKWEQGSSSTALVKYRQVGIL